jgi:holdfast attachment protein HfaA
MSSHTLTLIAVTAAGALAAADASAQASGSAGTAQFQAGYGASRYTTARPSQGTTRDANGNRLVVNGIIQSGASSYSSTSSGVSSSGAISGSGSGSGNGSGTNIGGATAIGNSLNVVVQGNRNTVIVNSTQNNSGNITAGTALNGTLVFP